MEHIWRVTDEHLALIEDPNLAPPMRDFAVQVLVSAFDHDLPERTLARTFEVLHRLVDRDDPLVGDLLPFLPAGDAKRMGAALAKLGARAFVRGTRRALASVIASMLSLGAPVPAEWMQRLLDLTSDAELPVDFVYLFFDWRHSKAADTTAHAAMLSDRPALRAAYEEVCSEYVEEGLI